MKPQGKVYYDDYDVKAQDYWDKFKEDTSKNLEFLHMASLEIAKSTNPEAKQISQLFKATYLTEKGKREKDKKLACKFLIKAATAFEKNKATQDIGYKTRLLFYKRKLEVLRAEGKSPTVVFKKMADIEKKLGRMTDYHAEMSLFYLYEATDSMSDLKLAKKQLRKGISHANKTNKPDVIHKLEGILHKISSYDSKSLEEAINEIEKEISSIEKTSDKYGIDIALGDLNFLKSKKISPPIEKADLLEAAASYYEKAGINNRAHQLRGNALQIRGNTSSPLDIKHVDYYQKSADEYKKAGNIRMQKWMEGHREVALASTRGILVGDNKTFEKHLMSANHAYKNAGNVGGIQFTAGVGIFLEALRTDYPKSISLFNSAAECLESVKEYYLSSFARSEVARIKASKAKNRTDRDILLLEEKNALERAVIEDKKKESKKSIEFLIGGNKVTKEVLRHLNKAHLEELSAFLEKDKKVANAHFKRAKAEYLAIENSKAFKNSILSGLGWSSLFLEDISSARDYFEKLKAIDPTSEHVRLGEQAITKLLKQKYSSEAENYAIEKRISLPLQISLSEEVSLVTSSSGKPHPSSFFGLWLAIVNNACNQLERYRGFFCKLGEDALRTQILIFSNSIAEKAIGATLTGETYSGEGKSDIFAKNSQEKNDYFLGECKIWKSQSTYKAGLEQLTKRYMTSSDKAGTLINFVKEGKIKDIFDKARNAILEFDPDAQITDIGGNTIVSEHRDHGVIFHRFVDLVSYKNE